MKCICVYTLTHTYEKSFVSKKENRKVKSLLLSKNNLPESTILKAMLNYSFNLIKARNLIIYLNIISNNLTR